MVVPAPYERIRALRNSICSYAESGKRLVSRAFLFPNKAQQKVLASNIVMAHCPRGFLREGKGTLCAFRATF